MRLPTKNNLIRAVIFERKCYFLTKTTRKFVFFFLRDDSDEKIVSNQPCDESKYRVEWKFEKTEKIEIL